MDRLLVTGGARLDRHDPRLGRQELRPEADGRGAARARAHGAAQRAPDPGLHADGRGPRASRRRRRVVGRLRHDRRRRAAIGRGALRPGPADAGLDRRARAAPRARRSGARSRCPAATTSGRARSTCTSAACRGWAPRSGPSTGSSYAETDGLRGASITLDYPSVGATENLMMAAVAAQGHHRDRQRRTRARDRRPRRLPERDGRADRGRGVEHDRDRRRGRRSRPPSTA